MNLTPLFSAPVAIQIHAFAALTLIPLTLLIFTVQRGSPLHKTLGWGWIIGMGGVALSSFWVHEIQLAGPFSPIHLLSVVALVTMVWAIIAIRRSNIAQHRRAMLWLVWGALAGAGVFTLLPGRIMHNVLMAG
jgi:uncharacterized membrane protein